MKEELKNLAVSLKRKGHTKESIFVAKIFKKAQEEGIIEGESQIKAQSASKVLGEVMLFMLDLELEEARTAFVEEIMSMCQEHDISSDFIEDLSAFLEAMVGE